MPQAVPARLLRRRGHRPLPRCDTCESGAAERYAEARAVEGETPFAVDTEVRHAEWGDGRVMSVEEDRITVFFASEGYRVLSIAAVTEHDLLTVLTGAVTSRSGARS